MYQYFATKRAPAAIWMLGDTSPYRDCTGSGYSAVAVPNDTTPTKSTPLVDGATNSTVVGKGKRIRFANTFLGKGYESRSFALEAWVLPVPRNFSEEQQPIRRNIATTGAMSNIQSTTYATGYSWGARTNWVRSIANAGLGLRYMLPLSELKASQPYTIAMTIGNPMSSAQSVDIDWSDGDIHTFSFSAGEHRRVSFIASRDEYTSVYRFIDIRTKAANQEFLVSDVAVFEGEFVDSSYFDGNYPGCVWEGEVGSSASTMKTDVSRVNLAKNPSLMVDSTGWAGPSSGVVTAPWDSSKKAYRAVGTTSSVPYIFSGLTYSAIPKGTVVTASATVKIPAGLKYYFRLHKRSPNTYFENQQYGSVLESDFVGRVSHTWELTEDMAAGNLDAALVAVDATGTAASTAGKEIYMSDVLIELSGVTRSYFDGSTPGGRWVGSSTTGYSEQIISFDDQQILSNLNTFDGLSIEGTTVKFRTEYATEPPVELIYDLGENRLAHIVGVHNPGKNELWVDGKLVGTAVLTDEQQKDDYKTASDGWFYCGGTVGAQELAVNAVAVYASLRGPDIERNYLAGINRLGQYRISPQYNGLAFPMRGLESSVITFEDWAVREEFEQSFRFNVDIGDEQVTPVFEELEDGSVESDGGMIEFSMPLDVSDDTTMYGVALEWSGQNISVSTSIDGEDYIDAENGELAASVPLGMDPTEKSLRIRVMFPPSTTVGESYLERIAATAMRDSKIDSPAARDVTVTHPAVPRADHEPSLFRDSNGIYLSTGSMTIGPDQSEGPDEVKTIEVWVKPVRGNVNLGFSGTQYRNGVVDSVLPVGEWSLVHIVSATDVTSAITMRGDCIIGQVTLYSDALTAGQIGHIWKSYCGTTAFRVVDETTVSIAESPTEVKAYSHDWAISASG